MQKPSHKTAENTQASKENNIKLLTTSWWARAQRKRY